MVSSPGSRPTGITSSQRLKVLNRKNTRTYLHSSTAIWILKSSVCGTNRMVSFLSFIMKICFIWNTNQFTINTFTLLAVIFFFNRNKEKNRGDMGKNIKNSLVTKLPQYLHHVTSYKRLRRHPAHFDFLFLQICSP